MSERIEREVWLPVSPEAVWDAVTSDGWLAERVSLDLRPGGEAEFESADGVRSGWIEDVCAPERLSFWWSDDDEPASRVELRIDTRGDSTRLRIVETRPLEVLDLVGVPLPGTGGATFGPALVAA
ncbi:MAG TPA: SRPBCC domain-containing protein [Solirubrobacteraceae bacterium]|nr:SRPBCC domain-containing protein [Solirubrobacteraceae bacterium]